VEIGAVRGWARAAPLFCESALLQAFSDSVQRDDFFPGATLAPDWCAEVLSKYGQNRYGENIFRTVFLPSRSKIVGGYWEAECELAYRRVPKYGLAERKWAIERFVPASVLGTPETWEALATTLEGYWAIGPFPAHGVYECCAVFTTGKGDRGYVPLEPELVDFQARAIWMGRTLTRYQVRSAVLGEEEEKIRKQDEYFERLLRDKGFSRDVATYGMAVNYNREQAVEDYKTRLVKVKAWQRRARFQPGFRQGMVN
jgi:hypothetical protein